MKRAAALLLISLLTTAGFAGEPAGAGAPAVPAADIVANYMQAMDKQQRTQKDLASDVIFQASIPKLKKQGKLSALRKISAVGRVTYKVLGFWGDDTVKKEVIARYMTLELDSASKNSGEMAITPENYNFKYKGLQNKDKSDTRVHVLELKPKKKRVGLFKGEIWLDEQTYMPVREQGRFVKSPSVFIKKVEFVRNYEIRDGVAFLMHMETRTDTRIVGTAELNVDYANYHVEHDTEAALEEARRRVN
ncbi:MAG: hypothetical protein SGI92_06585 [Bryobacteraceae bacterium]|nr:hypothetical protein [Bryobacteraceae bacterium]